MVHEYAAAPVSPAVNSPLGKYGQLVAAIIATVIILAWIAAELLYGVELLARQPAGLKEAALIALGAVFGAAATVNGVKSDIAGAHSRLDRLGAPSASASYDDIHHEPRNGGRAYDEDAAAHEADRRG